MDLAYKCKKCAIISLNIDLAEFNLEYFFLVWGLPIDYVLEGERFNFERVS